MFKTQHEKDNVCIGDESTIVATIGHGVILTDAVHGSFIIEDSTRIFGTLRGTVVNGTCP